MPIVYIGIGSNLGDREHNCLDAVKRIEAYGIKIKNISSLIETKPWGVKDQPQFINMVIEVETDFTPDELLKKTREIERAIGRKETYRWGPRVIDIDILLYDDQIIDTEDLKIPHIEMHERNFVLQPLSEIAPDVIHPVLKKKIKQIYDEHGNIPG